MKSKRWHIFKHEAGTSNLFRHWIVTSDTPVPAVDAVRRHTEVPGIYMCWPDDEQPAVTVTVRNEVHYAQA